MDDNRNEYINKAKEYYNNGMKLAQNKLSDCNPVRLKCYLNASEFYHEILKDNKNACEFGKYAFDKAIESFDDLNDNDYVEVNLIMQTLRDNLTFWLYED